MTQIPTLDFYSNIFRMFQDTVGGIVREPESTCQQNPRSESSKNVDSCARPRRTWMSSERHDTRGYQPQLVSAAVTDLRNGRQVMAES